MTEFPEKIRLALEEFGHSESEIAKVSGDSFVVQDLGIWGDDFDEFYEVLVKVYGTSNQIEAKLCQLVQCRCWCWPMIGIGAAAEMLGGECNCEN